ncbi:MAG: head-tail connector protein, partial [Hyphomicrobiaceae bacterium]
DAFLSSLIVTSRLHVEQALGLALVSQSWAWTLDAWPSDSSVVLPMRPVDSIESITLFAADGSPAELETWRYVLDGGATPPRLLPTATRFPDPGARALGIEIRFTAGFGSTAAEVPQPIRQALLLLVAHWYENREPVVSTARNGEPKRIPDTVSDLLMPYRLVRL